MSVSEIKLPPGLRRKLSPLHKQMDAAEVAGGVTPKPEIVNRRTGQVHKFGPRRAFDGVYVGEVLGASGCWTEDIEKALWVLAPLVECDCGDWTVKDLLDVLPVAFYERPTPEQLDQIRNAGEGASGHILNGEFKITLREPRLTVVE